MDSAKSTVQKEKQIELKLATVQKMIRNKFKKACSNRRANERNERNAMKTIASTTKNTHELKSSDSRTDNFTSSPVRNKSIKIEMNDPNALCIRLREILSSPNAHNALQINEKKEIINKLQELNFLV